MPFDSEITVTELRPEYTQNDALDELYAFLNNKLKVLEANNEEEYLSKDLSDHVRS